ncbi:MAG: hypothetical protein CMO98_02965 [Woeseia sp.]|nr:hypothetical protein [Woeseia sp.]|tara:strand:+ start:656 stop:1507 length:852 start_codon:yes stop_codon:yes gene_type:complete
MNRLNIPVVLSALLIAACGNGETPVAEKTIESAIPEETVAESAITREGESVNEQIKPQMVEESAAEEQESVLENKPIILAQATTADDLREWKFTEGTHYARLVPAQPTVGGADKIEVAEVFWYGCNHCYDFEAFINRWKENMPTNVRFVRIPAVWNPLVRLHAQLYYTEEVLVNNGKIANPDGFRAAVFAEYHRRRNQLTSMDAIQELFEKHGVSAEDFQNTWSSFQVSQKLRVAQDLGRRYGITGVPAMVVNGKYRSGAAEAGSYPKLLELIDELIVRESIR